MLTVSAAHALVGSASIAFSASGRLYTPVLQFLIELDTLRDGSYGGTYDDITAYVQWLTWRNGMSDAYQEVAPPARAQFRIDTSDGEWRQDWRGSEALSNGDFAAWTGDNPNAWTVTGESGSDPYVNEVGQSQLHGGSGTGCCNLYTTGATLSISQAALTIGTRYEVTLNVDAVDPDRAGGIQVKNGSTAVSRLFHEAGIKTFFFTATATSLVLETYGAVDMTLASISVYDVAKYCGTLNKETLLRVQAQAPGGVMTTLYIGQIENAPTAMGEWGDREFTITTECPMQRLLDLTYQPSLLLDTTVDAVISEIFDRGNLPYPYAKSHWILGVEGLSVLGRTTKLFGHAMTDFDTGNTQLPYAGDAENQTGKGTVAQGVIRSMMAAEKGRFFFNTRTGKFTLHNRRRDTRNDTVAESLTFGDLPTVEPANDDVKNIVTVNYEPREVGAARSVIWSMGGLPLTLEAGTRRELTARYTDPDSDKEMGAMDFVVPASGLDYIANTNEDGSGEDVTHKVSIAVEFGGSSATVWLDSDSKCYITTLQLRGTPLRRYDQQSAIVSRGESFYDNGKQANELVSIPAISDPDYAAGVARMLLGRYSGKVTRLAAVGFLAGYEAATAPARAINRSIGDRIRISDTWSGHDRDYIIVGEEHRVAAGSAMFWQVRWILKPQAREVYWRLGIPGHSELGRTTRLSL